MAKLEAISAPPRGSGRGMRVALARALFNGPITRRLERNARARLKALGAANQDIVTVEVPGAFELGFASLKLAQSGRFDAVIAMGCVIRGETSHYEIVCQAARDGVLQAGMQSGVPVIFGVLTVENEAQALARCAGRLDAGRHAAEAAVRMALLSRKWA